MRVLKDKPTIYINFERVGKRKPLLNGESNEGIWLRLHNNTRWSIALDMNDVPEKDYGDARLFYEVLSEDGKIAVDARCHVCSVGKLASGKSLLFSLPREYLDKGLAVRLSVNYEWEYYDDSSIALEPRHYVYYYSWDLPKSLNSAPNGQVSP